jgi:hypothetical protein
LGVDVVFLGSSRLQPRTESLHVYLDRPALVASSQQHDSQTFLTSLSNLTPCSGTMRSYSQQNFLFAGRTIGFSFEGVMSTEKALQHPAEVPGLDS